jgi:hypothetical protein
MTAVHCFTTYRLRVVMFVTVLAVLTIATSRVLAQTGDNAVCATTSCSGTGGIVASPAFIDASVFGTTTTDLCSKINSALGQLPATGGIVDARGLNSGNTAMTCAAGTTPWLQGTTFTTTPSDILLPAAEICIQSKWVIPDRTRVFGAGMWGSNGTYIYAANKTVGKPAGCSKFSQTFSDTEMIDMGYNGTPTGYPSSPAPCPTSNVCTGVAIDGLTLDGSGLDIGGIVNTNSEGLSYANQLTIREVLGTSTTPVAALTSSAPGVSRYTNIQSGSGSFTDNSTTECVALSQSSGLGGVHGMTCTGSDPAPSAALFLDASSNSVEDLHFEGFGDGVLVANVGNLLLNVETSTSTIGPSNYAAYLCGSSSASPCPTSGVNATDTVVLGLSSGGIATKPNTLKDDVTGTTLLNSTDSSVAMYVLGEPDPSSSTSSFSRLSSSPRFPTFGEGNGTPGTTCSSPGSVYSNWGATYTGSANTIWVCVGSMWTALK